MCWIHSYLSSTKEMQQHEQALGASFTTCTCGLHRDWIDNCLVLDFRIQLHEHPARQLSFGSLLAILALIEDVAGSCQCALCCHQSSSIFKDRCPARWPANYMQECNPCESMRARFDTNYAQQCTKSRAYPIDIGIVHTTREN